MEELNKYLNVFSKLISGLNLSNNNIYLGGSLMLKIHGLEFPRKVGDLDIIIYNATPEQKTYLESLSFFAVSEDYSSGDNFKFRKNDLYLNILCEDKPATINDNILVYNHKSINYKVCGIKTIIQAKARYSRPKDLKDLLALKNANFNITQ